MTGQPLNTTVSIGNDIHVLEIYANKSVRYVETHNGSKVQFIQTRKDPETGWCNRFCSLFREIGLRGARG